MRIRVDRDVAIRMSDGVCLYADIYRPAGVRSCPTIVTRTPYKKETERFTVRARYFAEHGYAFVIQDVRGCGRSQGEFYPFFHEARDGYETLTWASEQTWSTGVLGTIGASYGAWTQWLAATFKHPNLVTMISEASPPDFFQCLPYQGGAFSLPLLSWLAELDRNAPQVSHAVDWNAVLRKRPLRELDAACGHDLPAWRDWLLHDREDDYWARVAFNRQMDSIRLPVFHISGWFDDVLIGSLTNYSRMLSAGRFRQKLLVGPWPHRLNTTSTYGTIDFGAAGIVDLLAIQKEWFDRWLKSAPAAPDAEAPVTFFVMGENQWRNERQWPPASVRMEKLYFASAGRANTRGGDGRLEKSAPVADLYDEFSYDPLNPTPFLTDPGWIQLGGPDDYREVELREDVLVYSTPPLHENLRITGPLSVRLFAASSACDTDFTARLLDVYPDGYSMRLNDGIVRARFRSSLSDPSPIVTDRIYEYEIDCWATSHVFQKDHRVRIEISSSAFPRFDPNLNTGLPIASDCTAIIARQRIHHGSRYPSHVVLPVVDH
jgi:uncharacterized protein